MKYMFSRNSLQAEARAHQPVRLLQLSSSGVQILFLGLRQDRKQ